MKRTPIKERSLPYYNKPEDIGNVLSHCIGGVLGVIITVLAVIVSANKNNVWGIISGSIFGFTLISLYAVSSIYHGLKNIMARKIMQIIDHCMIYFLIAGTYTPILLSGIRETHQTIAWCVFGIEWGFAILGAVLNAIDLKKFKRFSMICYIGMGWCIIAVIKQTVQTLSISGFLWLLAGGIAYTLGAVLYSIGEKKPYYHFIFHIFVVFGSLLQSVCILKYIL